MVKDMTPLRAQIVAARAYEAGYKQQSNEACLRFDEKESLRLLYEMYAHRRAAEIMEAEAAKEEGGSNG